MKQKRFRLTPTQLISLSFAAVILVGTLLLMLPFASKGQAADLLTAMFTSTSATCVTGLVVRDTFTGWTTFGQCVILCLIQLGGLGFMTIITLVSFALGKHLGLYERKVLMQSAGNITLSGVGDLIRRIVPLTFVFEGVGAILLATQFVPEFGWGHGLYAAVFHSVSAFCNAGFDLMGIREPFSSLTAYSTNVVVNVTLDALIVIGGLGFLVWRDIGENGFHFKKYQLHTKLVLVTSGVLLLGGWVLLLIFEWNASLAGLTAPQKVMAALFQSVSARTAGFNTVDLSALSESGNILTDFLMMIGGSPGSTAGGIKTTTVAVVLISAFASARGRSKVELFHNNLDADTVRQANSIVTIYVTMALAAVMAICALDAVSLKAACFEAFSGVATVGLSLGVTPTLSNASRIIVILLMYAGRLGGLTFAVLFSQRKPEPPVSRPTGKILIG